MDWFPGSSCYHFDSSSHLQPLPCRKSSIGRHDAAKRELESRFSIACGCWRAVAGTLGRHWPCLWSWSRTRAGGAGEGWLRRVCVCSRQACVTSVQGYSGQPIVPEKQMLQFVCTSKYAVGLCLYTKSGMNMMLTDSQITPPGNTRRSSTAAGVRVWQQQAVRSSRTSYSSSNTLSARPFILPGRS